MAPGNNAVLYPIMNDINDPDSNRCNAHLLQHS